MRNQSAAIGFALASLLILVNTTACLSQTGADRILFSSVTEKSSGVVVMDPDGRNAKSLVEGASGASWSPNGCSIVFSQIGSSGATINVIDVDGSNQKVVALNARGPIEGKEMLPKFSPDGRKIVFVSSTNEIMVIGADGSGSTKLTNGAYAFDPTWGPDGRVHFFDTNTPRGIRVVNVDGSNPQTIATSDAVDPQWSPDGKKIAFSAKARAISVMNADGTNVRSLATGNGVARLPSWSPDGSKIAFESITDDDFSIAVINSDGTGQKTIGDHVLIEFESAIPPTWSPDGSRVAFTRMPMSAKELTAKGAEGAANLKFDIYSVNADGSGLKALTNTGRAAHPVWSPRSNCRH